jgi:GNAT superfamily N-acetyltransferase
VPSAMAWLGARLRAGRPGPRVRLTFGLPAGDDASAAAWRRALRGMAFAPTGGERTVLAHPGLPAGSPDPAVRRLRPGDQAALDEAAAVNGRAFGSPQAVSRFFLRPEVQETYVLALGTRLACVGCRYRGGGVYGIYSLGTEPALQRRGLAGRLLSQLLSGAGWTVLDTMPANVPFYRKRGFQPVAVLEEWSGAFDPGSA